MLDGKNYNLSLRWELNFIIVIIMQILRKEISHSMFMSASSSLLTLAASETAKK